MLTNNVLNFGEKWTKTINQEGIIGYERKIASSVYMQNRTETVTDSSIEEIVEVLKDIPAYPKWMHGCKKTILLDQKGEFNSVIYYLHSSHLDRADRDIVISANTLVDINSGKFITTLKTLNNPAYLHYTDGVNLQRLRMKDFKGTWSLRALKESLTKVSFTLHINPGEREPEYLINSLMRKVCYNSLQNLIAMAKKQKYIQAAKIMSPQKQVIATLYNIM
jgi:ribosome-associated toxin RatA of RatAB toxin-antitoxin module